MEGAKKLSLVSIRISNFIDKSSFRLFNRKYTEELGEYLQNLKMTYQTASMMQQEPEPLSSCSFLDSPESTVITTQELFLVYCNISLIL